MKQPVTIPHPDKPSEIDEVWQLLQKLRRCEFQTDRWDIESVGKWLRSDLDQLERAYDRLHEHMDEIYPDIEIEEEKEGVAA